MFWEIHGRRYDFRPFLKLHPGGKRMLMLAEGKDSTALFESTHLFDKKPRQMLAAFKSEPVEGYVPRHHFPAGGFYQTLRTRVGEMFKKEAEARGIKDYATRIGHGTVWFRVRLVVLMAISWTLGYHAIVHGNLLAALGWGPVTFFLGGYGHEALHGGVVSKPWLNRLIALFTMDLAGLSSYVYSFVHITEHHIDPNVERVDPDIVVHYPLMRQFQYQKRLGMQRYQHLYAWPVYAVSLFFANAMDYGTFFSQKWCNVRVARPYFAEAVLFWLFKAINLSVLFVAPLVLLGPGLGLAVILCMYLPASLIVNVSFALNHQTHEAMQLAEEQGPVKPLVREAFTDWGELQLRTACDYQHGFWLFDMFFSGLNYQVEHHLFPLISYSQLPKVAPIVRETAREFGIPYYYYPTQWQATLAHYRFLRAMGREDEVAHLGSAVAAT